MDNSLNLCNPSHLIMQRWIASFRLISSGPYVTAGAPVPNFTVPINLTRAVDGEIGCHMAIRCHNTAKAIALESLGFWGEIKKRKKRKSNLKQLDEVEFQAETRLSVGFLIPPTLI